MRLSVRLGLAVLLAGSLTACTLPPAEVTWFGNRTEVTEGPVLYCDLNEASEIVCPTTNGPTARLRLHADDSVQINIPSEVAERPWLLVISYADGTDSVRTPVINDDSMLSYTVRPNGHPLAQIDLQVLTITASAAGEPQFTPYQIWVLAVDQA